jgi:two-component system cell cycle sensor histidine kinase/response regulator CckA
VIAVQNVLRVDALRRTGLLDSPQEEAFDRLTRLASTLLKAPLAVVSLVDADRQFFKSSVGMPEPLNTARSTPLEYSFSQHAVASDSPLVIPDARDHPLTRGNPAVREFGLIAYAGIPLDSDDGYALGTLCVLDTVPRAWTDEEMSMLRDLAGAAMSEIALHRALLEREGAGREREALERALQTERDRFGSLFEQAPAFIAWARGPGHVFEGANRAYYQLVGHRDIIGKPVADAVPEVVSHGLGPALDMVLATGTPFVADGMSMLLQRMPGAEPEERFLNFVFQPLVEADGTRSGVFCHGVDVTTQVRATEALRAREAYHRMVLDSLPVIVYRAEATPPHEPIYVSRAVESLGFAYDEWVARRDMWDSRLHPDDRARVRRMTREALENAMPLDLRYRLVAKDGTVRWFHDRGELVPDRDGEHCVWQGIMMDITGQCVAEEALRATEARARTIVETAYEGIWVVDAVGVTTYANARMCEMLGYPAEQVVGRTLFDFMPPAEAFEARTLFARRQRGISDIHEFTFRRSDGSELFVLLSTSPLVDADGEFTGALAMATDITARRSMEQALRESEARFRHVIANAPGMVYQFVYRPDGTRGYTFVSEGARELFGIDPEAALRDSDALLHIIHPDEREQLRHRARAVAHEGGDFRWEGRAVLASGEERFVEVVARDHRTADGSVLSDGLVVDVTERRQLEEQFRQAQKMEAVGRLAGGVAHDFNNLLTVIKTSTNFLLDDLDPADPRREDARQVADAADRAAGLTRQLLAFSRKQVLEPQVVDVDTVVSNLRPMLARLIGEDVDVQVRLAQSAGTVLADVGQLEQVLINLAVNARDAMPDGGRLTIETSEVTIDERAAMSYGRRERCALVPGRYVMLAVSDTGTGMSPEVRARIFEPFYTTKEIGKGTGLGLSTVYGIVKQSGGHVWAYSEPGHGTVFKVYLPRLGDQPPAALRRTGESPARGTETVLLVEDDDTVRQLTSRILERHGYQVLASSNGRDALSQATGHGGPIHLILTDVVMPEMGGRALSERLTTVRPEAVVIYMSGYTDDEVLRRGMLGPGSLFIQKPFETSALLRLLRDALDHRRGATGSGSEDAGQE